MTDLSKVEQKLVKQISSQLCNVSDEYIEKEILPVIHSHTDTLIAAAISECANVIEEKSKDGYQGRCSWGDLKTAIRSFTPDSARRALERNDEFTQADTIMRFRKLLDRLGIHGYYSEMQKEFCGND